VGTGLLAAFEHHGGGDLQRFEPKSPASVGLVFVPRDVVVPATFTVDALQRLPSA